MSRETSDDIFRGFLAINAMLREELALVRRALARRQWERKYNPDWPSQPRAPRGVPEGGQWVDGGGASKVKPQKKPPSKQHHRDDIPRHDNDVLRRDERIPPFFADIADNPYFGELTARGLLTDDASVADFFNLRFDLLQLRSSEFSAVARRAGMSPAELRRVLDHGANVMSERAIAAVEGLFDNPGMGGVNIVRREEALHRYIELSGVRPEYQERMFTEIIGLAGFTFEEFEQHKLVVGVGLQLPGLLGIGAGPRPTPAATPRPSARSPTGPNVWRLPPVRRGEVVGAALRHNVPRHYPVVDRIDDSGLVTSIKSVDLNSITYQRPATLRSLLEGHIDRIAGFRGARHSGFTISEEQITGRALDLVIPHGGDDAQRAVIEQAIRYGESKGVIVNIIIMPR